MDVQMRHRFSAIAAIVDHQPETGVVKTFLVGNRLGDADQVA